MSAFIIAANVLKWIGGFFGVLGVLGLLLIIAGVITHDKFREPTRLDGDNDKDADK